MFGSLKYFIYLQDGKTDVIADDSGDRVTPAMVAFTETEQVKLWQKILRVYCIVVYWESFLLDPNSNILVLFLLN